MNLLAAVLLCLGGLLLVISAWGVVRLPNALSRQHAATKAGTLSLALICLGAGMAFPQWAWVWRLGLILLLLLLTLPLAAQMLARAALAESGLRHGPQRLGQAAQSASGPSPGSPGPARHSAAPLMPPHPDSRLDKPPA